MRISDWSSDVCSSDLAGLDQVDELAVLGVEAPVGVLRLQQLADDHRAVMAGVAGDLPGRGLERAPDDVHAHALVVVARLDLIERADGDRKSTRLNSSH